MMNFKKNIAIKAFTLAEVLIVLAVIGVVAAMTMPMLVQNYQKKVYVNQLREVYSQLTSAVEKYMTDEGVEKVTETQWLSYDNNLSWEDNLKKFENFAKSYFKVSKYCGVDFSGDSPCFAPPSEYKRLNGEFSGVHAYGYSFTTKNGVSLSFNYVNNIPDVFIDLNGPNKPNVGGRDVFILSLYYDGSLSEITPECHDSSIYAYTCSRTQLEAVEAAAASCIDGSRPYGAGCFTKIENDGWKMDY